MPFIDNKWWDCIPYSVNTLNNNNLLSIAWLNELQLSTSFKANNYFYKPNNAYLKASFIKVIYIIILNTIFIFSLFNKLKLHTNNL